MSIKQVVELGGLHTLIYLAKEEDQTIKVCVMIRCYSMTFPPLREKSSSYPYLLGRSG
jgi:hypothetical protein